MVKENKVKCPKCNSDTWKFGTDPLCKKQRYRCKNLQKCGYQFAPDRPPRIKKYPSFICPRCGSNMTIFKHLSDGFRLRCNRHNAKGSKKCTHKINIPLPGRTFKIAKDPIEAVNVDGIRDCSPMKHSSKCKAKNDGYGPERNQNSIPSKPSSSHLKDNGLTLKPLHDHLEASKANLAYGALSLPESTGITTSCRTKDSMEKLQPKLLAKNYLTVTTS